jgi:predicted amidohydrolase
MQDLQMLCVQANLVWEDAPANHHKLAALLAPFASADLILLPEMFASGFTMQAQRVAQTMQGPSVAWMQALAHEKNALVVGSLVITEADQFYNRLIWAEPDGTLRHYDKRHCFRMAGEHEVYTPGQQKLIAEWRGWRICPLICYDLRFPVWSRNPYAGTPETGYDLLVYVANWPERRAAHWRNLLEARAIENLAYVAAVNRAGTDANAIAYRGDSGLLDWHGEWLAHLAGGEGVVQTTLAAQPLLDFRKQFPAWMDADAFALR